MLGKQIRKEINPFTEKTGKFFGRFANPNTYTYLSLLVNLAGSALVFLKSFEIAIAMFVFGGLLDYIDGAVARAMKKESRWGAMLDSTTDKISEISIYIALFLAFPQYSLGAILACSSFMLSSYISKHGGALGVETGGGIMERKERYALLFIGIIALILIYPQVMEYALYVIAALSLVTALWRLARARSALKNRTKT